MVFHARGFAHTARCAGEGGLARQSLAILSFFPVRAWTTPEAAIQQPDTRRSALGRHAGGL